MIHGREKVVRFGANSALVGIMTEPATGSASRGKPAFVMLNSGILHRVGSCRLSVRLARALSAQGFCCLRFDYSGIGDSDQRRDAMPFEESSVLETQQAMDYLAKAKGAQQFALMGLCSGADMAHHTAVVDERVVGLMMLDAWAYRTAAYYVRHYGPRLLSWRAWLHSVWIRFQMLLGTSGDRASASRVGMEVEAATYVRVFPPREKVERELTSFVDRRVSMYCIWTGGLAEYNHQGQYAAAFRRVDFKGLLREDYLADADHIVTGLKHQDYVLENVLSWSCALATDIADPSNAVGGESPGRAS